MVRAGMFASVGAATLLTPAFAYADGGASSSSPVRLGVSLLGLIVSVVLLVETLMIRKVAMGGAIAEKISFVILATLCLAASAVAAWTQNFVVGVTLEQVQMASEVLVIVAMLLLALYFAGVRRALLGYLNAMTGSQRLDKEIAERTAAGEDDGA